MSKQLISIHGEDHFVREDTAKAHRGIHWALWSLGGFILIIFVLFLGGVLKLSLNGTADHTPAQIEKDAGR